MSELKEIGIRWEENGELHFSYVYHKYEADKVIAHHKYKRCLAMAEWCKARYDEEGAKLNRWGSSWDYVSEEMKYWERWQKRWMELAEKFKEEK